MQKPTLFEGARIPIGARAADTGAPPQEAVVAGGVCRHRRGTSYLDGRCRAGREQCQLYESGPDFAGAWDYTVAIAVGLGEEGRRPEATAKS